MMVVPAPMHPTPPNSYAVLTRIGSNNSGFVVRHKDRLLGICSMHLLLETEPLRFQDRDGRLIELDPNTTRLEGAVQMFNLSNERSNIPFLEYLPDFALKSGDEVLVLRSNGAPLHGTILEGESFENGEYKSSDGARQFEIQTDEPLAFEGARGSPVVLKSTGKVIGVITRQTNRTTGRAEFDSLCIAKTIEPNLALGAALRETASLLRVGQNWETYGHSLSQPSTWFDFLPVEIYQTAEKYFTGGWTQGLANPNQLESASVSLLEFSDAQFAQSLPLAIARGYNLAARRPGPGDIQAQTIHPLVDFPCDGSSVVRALEPADIKTFVWIARGNRLVEIALSGFDISDADLFPVVESAFRAAETSAKCPV